HFSRHIMQILGTHEVSDTFEIVMADGRVVTQLSYPVNDQQGRFIGRLWVYEDVTRERQTAEQLIYLAERDSLTGLYNRHRFQEELSRMLADAERRSNRGALLFFDLDEFKYVNDTFGHRAGDAMLIRVAGEVSALVRRNEIISRIGGDEFAILIPDATQETAIHLAERIIRSIAQIPFRFEGQNLRLTTSLGIALYPDHGANTEELVAHADTAMYLAKEAGKNAWRVYSYDLDASREMLHRLTWNERVSNALENNLLQLHFQGIYDARSGELAHLEALVRMVDEADPSRIIMPGHFIPAAEKTGKVLDIDRWVIHESIRRLAATPSLAAIAVNISGRSFDDVDLPQYIARALAELQVEPKRLMVELTETSAVSDLHDAQRFIESLHKTGCQTCLDDFGSGFSSFAYLKHLRADILKIDGLFIRDLPNDRDNQIFVKSIVDVARGMRKLTVAEFVEDAETLEMLRHFGVDLVQGYYLDMPQADHPALLGQ
ncbi:MAG: EAL domain-containing protein, partial [Gammaproteobacteria bacterium]